MPVGVTAKERLKMGELMDLLVAHEPRIHYGQARPMKTATIKTVAQLAVAVGHSLTMDCSESVTLICRLAGLEDPNGRRYDGYGNTQEMYDHLPRYTRPINAGVGALVFFGIPGQLATQHVCMVRKSGYNPTLFSHGQERGPLWIPLSEEKKYHQGTPTFLSISHL